MQLTVAFTLSASEIGISLKHTTQEILSGSTNFFAQLFQKPFNLFEIVMVILIMIGAESGNSFSQFLCSPHSRFSSAFAGSK
jgi:hypothetical protein